MKKVKKVAEKVAVVAGYTVAAVVVIGGAIFITLVQNEMD